MWLALSPHSKVSGSNPRSRLGVGDQPEGVLRENATFPKLKKNHLKAELTPDERSVISMC